MSKVLISFLGTGPDNKDKNKADRKYRDATYRFENGETIKSSFVADALSQHYSVDKIIMIGTVKSMWERVYEVFCNKNGIEPNEDYYCELSDICDNASHKYPLELPGKEKIEEQLGEGSHVVLIHYGLNSDELNKNTSIILGIEEYISDGDEVYIDITHAFRSLPLYIMNLLIYLKNVSNKRITIPHISYGMLDVSGEFKGITPVVELNGIMNTSDWITGASAFSQFGNGYHIAELIKEEDSSTSKIMENFSDDMNLNFFNGMRTQAQKLASIKNKKYSAIPSRIITPTVNAFVRDFPTDVEKSVFLLNVAIWHYNHRNYSSSFISLLEAILSHVCEYLGIPSETSDDMEVAKVILGKRNHIEGFSNGERDLYRNNLKHYEELSACYDKVNKIRNALAHQKEIRLKENGHDKVMNAKEMIRILDQEIKNMKRIIR